MASKMTPNWTTGPRNAITDISGVVVGNAADQRLRSGVTVLTADAAFTAGVHVMGGAPGTRETDLLAPDKSVQKVDALVLSGGSAFGLASASAIADELRKQGRGFTVAGHNVPIVPAAILFDLNNGGDKSWDDNPYHALGRTALAAAGTDFAIGSQGAGFGATTATLMGGLGTASLRLPSGVTVAALVAVNALGSTTVKDSAHFWAAPFEMNDEFGGKGPARDHADPAPPRTKLDGANTTIAIVATDADLSKAEVTRFATAAHDGMARAIVPSHTAMDGDLVFGLSTHQHALQDPGPDLIAIGHGGATCLARAIARAVHAASAEGPVPTWASKFA